MGEQRDERQSQESSRRKKAIKCLVWDLDNTLWDEVLLEDRVVFLRDNVVATIEALDSRGILQSIASRNDYDSAMQQLAEFDLDEYFLYPQINWGSKASSIQTIVQSINIGMDTIAFIDDQQFERLLAGERPHVGHFAAAHPDSLTVQTRPLIVARHVQMVVQVVVQVQIELPAVLDDLPRDIRRHGATVQDLPSARPADQSPVEGDQGDLRQADTADDMVGRHVGTSRENDHHGAPFPGLLDGGDILLGNLVLRTDESTVQVHCDQRVGVRQQPLDLPVSGHGS